MQARFRLTALFEEIPAEQRQPARTQACKEHGPTGTVAQSRPGLVERQSRRIQLARRKVLAEGRPFHCRARRQYIGQVMADPQQQHQAHQRDIERQGDQPGAEVDARGHACAISRDGAGGGVGGWRVGQRQASAGHHATEQYQQAVRLCGDIGHEHRQKPRAHGCQAQRG